MLQEMAFSGRPGEARSDVSVFTDRLRRQPADRARWLADLRRRVRTGRIEDVEEVEAVAAILAGWLAPRHGP